MAMARTKQDVKKVIVHCTASGPKTTLEDIKKWHIARGFSGVGYHYVILADGQIKQGRAWQDIGAHCEGHNKDSLGISLVGGDDGKTVHKFSAAQMKALDILLEGIFISFGRLQVYGHRDFSTKSCPCFDVAEFMKSKKLVYLK